ncbi:RdgB/HAM1 family non-canonical purine NTP pyrophosphatase [Tuwongella immobilis]|uniref:dITP/XTP pyrophosphatase n=1 Tax=Tuwongella immobilis TaxID=692036 RepID=A0A6C2YJ92_9BACT|nr:RdgB/HAM1 family non-canonical purine NTP pyrophosphatase [Tuwongella immobilis]VIP01457.1 ntp phosphatase : Non-canonical purine NTP pyrophosphatase OS=Planctomyces limnophilus (strain ATCC 43296 / DSM 3776 / IFAM 1008 / 290) GN=Plim_2323 PE=3 SV=1: Ham1p_like [Tuwongella immobilis]VTR98463.1 ntp phosphatase : Non-canonical purine NTP pyrophosphatase OS=Planctomyces limnophilus (strain ATCC 43296 / DSM 3776 / IFAM 1008 / 290) GN=Plim_2323 PE=3 SV=1: Ham1p_like [Tuwongella immobilis]
MPRLVFGTRNRKKLVELRDLLADFPLECVDLSPWPELPDVDETGDTFEANARLKASEFSSQIHEWTLSEDSGLVVPALGGRPGIFSARYAGSHGDDAANNQKIVQELAELPEEKRAAYYVCVAALANPAGEVVAVAEGRCHGRMLLQPQGSGGFGYDPLFYIPEYHQTFGELSLRVKQALSHRAKAIVQLRPEFRKIA